MVNCLTPSTAWVCGTCKAKDGVVSPNIVFSSNDATDYFRRFGDVVWLEFMKNSEISVPCGKCAACRLRKRKDMSVRLAHEASCHAQACFVTLTYDDDHVPLNAGCLTLAPSDVQLFVKRLRRHLEYQPKKSDGRDHVDHPIRYFCVGEYGGKTHRPHYHLMIFGWTPSDKCFLRQQGRIVTYRSAQVEKLWTAGFSTVQDVSPFVAKYVARYVSKKFTSDWLPSVHQVPEFVLQSVRHGGIGAPWFDRYGVKACENRFVTYRICDQICKASVPKYYYSRLRDRFRDVWIRCRDERLHWIVSHRGDVNPERDRDALERKVACDLYDQIRRKEREVL